MYCVYITHGRWLVKSNKSSLNVYSFNLPDELRFHTRSRPCVCKRLFLMLTYH